jgi:hypothetical protein
MLHSERTSKRTPLLIAYLVVCEQVVWTAPLIVASTRLAFMLTGLWLWFWIIFSAICCAWPPANTPSVTVTHVANNIAAAKLANLAALQTFRRYNLRYIKQYTSFIIVKERDAIVRTS